MERVALWSHQKSIIEAASHHNNFAIFAEMGTGKTAIAIHALEEKCRKEGRLLRTLIFCPPLVIDNWRREFLKHSTISPNVIRTLYGSGSKRHRVFSELIQSHIGNKAIFITNYESLLMPSLFSAFYQWYPEVLILDESHRVKQIQAKRTKQAVKLSETVRYKFILTGTPILNSPMDIFSQYLILDNGETFGRNFFAFRATYFWDKNAGMNKLKYFPDWQIKDGSLAEINRRIYAKAARVTKAECLDLPPLLRETIYVEMTAEQTRLYNEMKKHFIAYLGDHACVAELAITKALRLQQIVSGYLKTDDGTVIEIRDNPRQQALHELLETLTKGHKVLVWAVFKQNYEQIKAVCKTLGVQYVECHGEISQKQKDDSVHRFNTDDAVRVFIGHPRSGGIGVNLVVASYAIFYSRNFSLEDDLQAESRNHRGGSEVHLKITRIDLVTQGTIDELVLDALSKKEAISEKTLVRIKEQSWKTQKTMVEHQNSGDMEAPLSFQG